MIALILAVGISVRRDHALLPCAPSFGKSFWLISSSTFKSFRSAIVTMYPFAPLSPTKPVVTNSPFSTLRSRIVPVTGALITVSSNCVCAYATAPCACYNLPPHLIDLFLARTQHGQVQRLLQAVYLGQRRCRISPARRRATASPSRPRFTSACVRSASPCSSPGRPSPHSHRPAPLRFPPAATRSGLPRACLRDSQAGPAPARHCARYSSSSNRTSTWPAFTLSPFSTPIHSTRPATFEATSILCAATMYPVAVSITCSPGSLKPP